MVNTHFDEVIEFVFGLLQTIQNVDERLALLIIKNPQWLTPVVQSVILVGDGGLSSDSDHQRPLQNHYVIIEVAGDDFVAALSLWKVKMGGGRCHCHWCLFPLREEVAGGDAMV